MKSLHRYALVFWAAALVLATAAAEPSGESLSNTSWQLVKIETADGTTKQPDDSAKYVVAFKSDGSVIARLDCNRGRGTWKVTEDTQIEFGPMALTMAMCPPESLSGSIAGAWNKVSSYELEDGMLRLEVTGSGDMVFEPSLAITSWKLTEIENADGTSVKPSDPAKYTLAFDADGSVSAQLDCNRGHGTWKVPGPNQIAFGPMATTRAMCPPGSLSDRFAKDLASMNAFALEDDGLRLELSGGGAYHFEPVVLKE